MIGPLLSNLARKRIVLASASPRRREILQSVGLVFEIIPSTFEEDLDKRAFTSAHGYARENARRKALDVAGKLKAEGFSADLVVGVDTIVVLENDILEKPQSEDDAKMMLKRLSGQTHTVVSGVALMTSTDVTMFDEVTDVTFASLSDAFVDYYVGTGEPMDKAGAYPLYMVECRVVEVQFISQTSFWL
jgi:septum formation protein